jgi:hypothetical protein
MAAAAARLAKRLGLPQRPTGVVTRPAGDAVGGGGGGGGADQVLLLENSGGFHVLEGADRRDGVALGPPLALRAGAGVAAWPPAERTWCRSPVWEPATRAVFFIAGGAVCRLGADNTVTAVAGRVVEQLADPLNISGGAARFGRYPTWLAAGPCRQPVRR